MRRPATFVLKALAVAMAALWATPAVTQEEPDGGGQTRIQGLPYERNDTGPSEATSDVLDYREEMRRFIERIAQFAHGQRRNFIVVVQNGLDLIEKSIDGDETRSVPARTYLRSIDGVLVETLHYGAAEPDMPIPERDRETRIAQAKKARDAGLVVLALEFGRKPETVREAEKLNRALGFVPLTVGQRAEAINRLPSFPSRPYRENPNSVISLRSVSNFGYLRDSSTYGTQEEFALAMHGTNFDMLVVDVFHGRRPLSRRAVETLKFKKLGARRLVLAYVDIGSAARYRYYWQPEWQRGSPPFLSDADPQDPDRHFVEYWDPRWQQIVSGDTQSYVYGVIAQGFDGIVLGGVDTYRFFETGGDLESLNRP